MTASYEDLRAWDRAHVWHPFTQMLDWMSDDPLIISRGEGNYLIDVQGNRYLDGVSSLWCNLLGHNHPHLNTGNQVPAGSDCPLHTTGFVQCSLYTSGTKAGRAYS